MEDAAEIAALIGNLTGPAEETALEVLHQISRFNDTCQGDSGGPLFIKGMQSCHTRSHIHVVAVPHLQ